MSNEDLKRLFEQFHKTKNLAEQKVTRSVAPDSRVQKYEEKHERGKPGNETVTLQAILENLHLMDELVADGLEAFIICWHGRGRSLNAMVESNLDYDTPSVCLSGGAESIGLTVAHAVKPQEVQDRIVDQLSKPPFLVILLSRNELAGSMFGNKAYKVIDQLREKCKERGTLLCWDGFGPDEQESINYRNFLLHQASRMKTSSSETVKASEGTLPPEVQT